MGLLFVLNMSVFNYYRIIFSVKLIVLTMFPIKSWIVIN